MHDEASEVDHDGDRRDHREGVYDDTRIATQKRSRSKAAIHRVTPRVDNVVE